MADDEKPPRKFTVEKPPTVEELSALHSAFNEFFDGPQAALASAGMMMPLLMLRAGLPLEDAGMFLRTVLSGYSQVLNFVENMTKEASEKVKH